MKEVLFTHDDDYIFTNGLAESLGRELQIPIKECSSAEYYRVLRYLVEYLGDGKVTVKANETIAFHSWLLKFVSIGDSFFQMWEARPDGDDFVSGVDYALNIVKAQEIECEKNSSIAVFPLFSQKLVISKGIYDGLPVQAVRYPSPDHMTGWWLTTDLYDDDVDSLEVVHYFEVAFKRPDILKYLALPFGYRFYAGATDDVWFDEEVLKSN